MLFEIAADLLFVNAGQREQGLAWHKQRSAREDLHRARSHVGEQGVAAALLDDEIEILHPVPFKPYHAR
jgi:hypothetical protein